MQEAQVVTEISVCSIRLVLFNREAVSYFIMLLVLGCHHGPMEIEQITEGLAIGVTVVFYTVVTLDVCDCIKVCDWTHWAMLGAN